MRGHEEIKDINENPHRHQVDGTFDEGHDRSYDFESNKRLVAELRAKERARAGLPPSSIAPSANEQRRPLFAEGRHERAGKAALVKNLDDTFFTLLLLDLLAAGARTQPKHEERIESAIDVQPDTPFFAFWKRLNAELTERGKPEAGYQTARQAFNGGATPIGALTFIGKDFEGLRAVPAQPVAYLGGTRPSYHGEIREVSEAGTKWSKVVNSHGDPILYTIPEAALTAARELRNTIAAERLAAARAATN